jgi:PRTRC genetic system protein B
MEFGNLARNEQFRELLAPAPRPMVEVDAEILFAGEQVIYHARTPNGEVFNYVTSKDLAIAFSIAKSDSGWLPAGVIRCGYNRQGDFFVFAVPAGKHRLRRPAKVDLEVALPGMLMILFNQKIHVFAVKESSESSPDAVLFHAPLSNLFGNGAVCWGTNTLPDFNAQNAAKIWQLFIESEFNNDLADRKSHKYPKNVWEMLEELNTSGAEYPLDDLKPVLSKTGLPILLSEFIDVNILREDL